jgi:DNA-binding MarR family transcriptional regulator
MMDDQAVNPRDLDLGTLATLTGNALSQAILAELHDQGHSKLRISHGFVFQHLVAEDRTIGALAERMEVTQQAASKTVAELETFGYLERAPDPSDARVRRVRLTKRGRAAIETARAARARQAARLAKKIGARRLAAASRVLVAVLELVGENDAIRERRVRAPA